MTRFAIAAELVQILMAWTAVVLLGSASMGMRMDALWRIVAFVWAWVASFVAGFVSIIGLIWGLIDVVWQLIIGTDGLSSGSRPARFVIRVIRWPVNLHVYAYTGRGSFQLLP